jgi:hypothetical protein
MENGKRSYYVDLQSGDILEKPLEEKSPKFRISATDREYIELKRLFDRSYSADFSTFIRAQIPFREYHKDPENARYDDTMKKIYGELYKLGDNETRKYIENLGILTDDLEPKNEKEDLENLK